MSAYAVSPLDLIEAQIEGLRQRAKDMTDALTAMRAECAHLKKENASLWESIRERDDLIRELQDMNMRGRGDL